MVALFRDCLALHDLFVGGSPLASAGQRAGVSHMVGPPGRGRGPVWRPSAPATSCRCRILFLPSDATTALATGITMSGQGQGLGSCASPTHLLGSPAQSAAGAGRQKAGATTWHAETAHCVRRTLDSPTFPMLALRQKPSAVQCIRSAGTKSPSPLVGADGLCQTTSKGQ